MTKILPVDTIIMLHNKLGTITARNPQRKLIIQEAATFYGVSTSTIYRYLRKHERLSTVRRTDYNKPRLTSEEQIKRYCYLIAALRRRSSNKKGRRLSIRACIKILENYGIETKEGLIRAPLGLLKKSTVSFYLNRLGLGYNNLEVSTPFIRFQAQYSNECWQFDFSPSDFKGFVSDKLGTGPQAKLMLLSVVDEVLSHLFSRSVVFTQN